MKKNKILIYLLMALPALLLTSCLKDQEDTFSTSSAERLQNYLGEAQKVLVGSEYGWAMEYYTDRTLPRGAYNYTLRFTEDSVFVRSEINNNQTEKASLYRVATDDGPILTFDTYNDILHYFATPSSSLYEAYDGDFEFVIDKVSEDLIVMHGKRNQNTIYLYKLTKPAEEYLNEVADYQKRNLINTGVATFGEDTVTVFMNSSNRKAVFTVSNPTDTTETEIPFAYYNEGIRLYKPFTVDNKEFRILKYVAESVTFEAQDAEGIVFNGRLMPSIVTMVVGTCINAGNAAFTKTFEFAMADEFTYTTDADWLTATAEGNVLTISATQNDSGSARNATITVEVNGYTATIDVVQLEISNLLGSYTAKFLDSDGIPTTAATTISAVDGGGYQMSMKYLNHTFKFNIEWDEENNRFTMLSGQYIGKYGSSYYIYNIYIDSTDSDWTGYSTDVEAWLTPGISNGKIQLSLGGYFSNYEIATIGLYAFSSQSFSDTLGYLDLLSNFTLVKD